MNNTSFLVLCREPDGRTDTHTPEDIAQHRLNWKNWMDKLIAGKNWGGGQPLTLTGKVIKDFDRKVTNGLYAIGTEIVGGYFLLHAAGLEEATTLARDCPIFDFGGFAEVRELMNTPAPPSWSPAEENKQIVRRFNTDFIEGGDIYTFNKIIDPDVINHSTPPGFAGNAAGMLAVIEAFRAALTGLSVTIHQQIAENDWVVTRKTFHAIHTGELLGLPPSGKKVAIHITDTIRLENGRYKEHWSMRDLSGLYQPEK